MKFFYLLACRVNDFGGFVHLATEQLGHGFEAAVYGLLYAYAVVLRGFFQHPIGDFAFISWVAYADA